MHVIVNRQHRPTGGKEHRSSSNRWRRVLQAPQGASRLQWRRARKRVTTQLIAMTFELADDGANAFESFLATAAGDANGFEQILCRRAEDRVGRQCREAAQRLPRQVTSRRQSVLRQHLPDQELKEI